MDEMQRRAENAEKVLADHLAYVQRFLQDLWAVLVDPVEDAPGNVVDTCKALLAAATSNREALAKASGDLCTFCCGEDPYMVPGDCICEGLKTSGAQIKGMRALIEGNFLDRKRLSRTLIEEKKELTDRAVKAERLFREQTSTKYDGEILCIRCHNIGSIRPFMQCFEHNPKLLEATSGHPQIPLLADGKKPE